MGKCRDCQYMGVVSNTKEAVCSHTTVREDYEVHGVGLYVTTSLDYSCDHFLSKIEPTVSFGTTTSVGEAKSSYIRAEADWLQPTNVVLPKIDKAVEAYHRGVRDRIKELEAIEVKTDKPLYASNSTTERYDSIPEHAPFDDD